MRSDGSTIFAARPGGQIQVPASQVDLVGLQQGRADLVALGGEEGEGHGPADEDPVGHADQVADRVELVLDLRAAEHDHVGPPDVRGQPAQRGDLGPDQVAGGVRQAHGDVVDAGLLPVQDAEPVRDVQVGQRGELVGEHAPLRVVLAGLPSSNRRFSSMTSPPGRSAATAARADGPAVSAASSPGGRAARRGGPRPAPASTSGRACPPGGRDERRRSPWRRGPAGRSGSAARPGSGRRPSRGRRRAAR